MKTLLLTDEVWSEIELTLEASDRGRRVLKVLHSAPRLPSDHELVRLARLKADPPEAFARAAAFRDAARVAGEDTRETMNDLILRAHKAGVGPRMLSRWSGLQESRIFEILAEARSEV